ncbi:response regulator transcription factor [uncultured Lactobacillus sp.]|uniref:response regulator transcription factor n=1 Tax=uncultured Lactobacillus sp. TaxID=153152 RepID=UPI00260B5644|nr:response regulator transcription factor [uncultured Lactobacillus sp.]
MKILLAEDEPQLNHVITVALQSAKYDVDSVFNGQEAVNAASKNAYDAMIFDIMMPVMDGITALKKIREQGNKTYVMMLTAKSEVDDKVTGLESGADDYLTKPFSLKELIARLHSLERRSENYSTENLQYGDLKLNVSDQELVAHNSIRLANKETELLQYFLLNSDKDLSAQELITHIWKNDPEANSELVWLYVSYLKQKLASIQSEVKILGEKGGSFRLTK